MVSESVLWTAFAVGAHCAAVVIAFHVAAVHRDIPVSRGSSTAQPNSPPVKRSVSRRALSQRPPIAVTPTAHPRTRSSSSTPSPVPSNTGTSAASPTPTEAEQQTFLTPPTSRPPPASTAVRPAVIVPAVDLAQIGGGGGGIATPRSRGVVVSAIPLHLTPNGAGPFSCGTLTFSDDELMYLIDKIQEDPASHARWKELRKWLLMQRHEERQRGRRRQAELPVVCFSEDPELVSLQVEVRSLIARERVRYPIGSRQMSQQSVVGSTGPPTPISSRATHVSTPPLLNSARYAHHHQQQQLQHSHSRMSRGRLAYEGPPFDSMDDDFSDHGADSTMVSNPSLVGVASPPACAPPTHRGVGTALTTNAAASPDVDAYQDEEDELENQLYEQLCERISRKMTLRRSARHIAEVYQALRVEDTSEDGCSTTAPTPRDALLSHRSAESNRVLSARGMPPPRTAVSLSVSRSPVREDLLPPFATSHHDTSVEGDEPHALPQVRATSTAPVEEEALFPIMHPSMSTVASEGNPSSVTATSFLKPPLAGGGSNSVVVPPIAAMMAADDTSDDALAQFVQHRVVALRNNPAFTKIQSDDAYKPFVRDFLRLEEQMRRISQTTTTSNNNNNNEPQKASTTTTISVAKNGGHIRATNNNTAAAAGVSKLPTRPWNYSVAGKNASATSTTTIPSNNNKHPQQQQYSTTSRHDEVSTASADASTTKSAPNSNRFYRQQTANALLTKGSSSRQLDYGSEKGGSVVGDGDNSPSNQQRGGGTLFHSALPPLTTVSLSRHNRQTERQAAEGGSPHTPQPYHRSLTYTHSPTANDSGLLILDRSESSLTMEGGSTATRGTAAPKPASAAKRKMSLPGMHFSNSRPSAAAASGGGTTPKPAATFMRRSSLPTLPK